MSFKEYISMAGKLLTKEKYDAVSRKIKSDLGSICRSKMPRKIVMFHYFTLYLFVI